MLTCKLDHLVLVAASLDEGARYCHDLLGVWPSGGGEHAGMGTHNRLLYLGPGLYLEIIAINPAASKPDRPRWFGMPDCLRDSQTAESPTLKSFAVRTENIDAACRKMPRLGAVESMQRGELHWKITLTEDGSLQEGGCLPTVIQWPPAVHPTAAMPDTDCRLIALEVHHPDPAWLAAQWHRLGLEADSALQLCAVTQAEDMPRSRLVARIATPTGMKILG